jgi:hypothetical protein
LLLKEPVVVSPAPEDKKKAAKRKVGVVDADSDYDTGLGRNVNRTNEHDTQSPRQVGLAAVVSPEHAGADKSNEVNEVYDVNMANEAAAYRLLSPPGADAEVEQSLVNHHYQVRDLMIITLRRRRFKGSAQRCW